MSGVQAGDRVAIHYTLSLHDGSVVDSSVDGEPLGFTVGGEEVIAGINLAVIGMEPGQSKQVAVPPDKAYGLRQPGLTGRVGRDKLPSEVREGDPLQATGREGAFIVWVKELKPDYAVVDANHPLAGQTLIFDIQLVAAG